MSVEDSTETHNQDLGTDPGKVMGTVGYMAPEQVRGQDADHRTDIFAVGVVLYEMLAGKRAFTGQSAVETMNAILKEEPPDLAAINGKIAPGLVRVVSHCLEKNPQQRFQSASDLAFALEALSGISGSTSALSATAAVEQTREPKPLAWILATVALVLALLALLPSTIAHLRQAPAEARVMKFSVLPPEKASLGSFAVSPDGRWLAFTAATGGKDQLWVRALDELNSRALPGTEGASYPFWSPDSRSIAFFANVKLKKIEVTGGPVQTVCDVRGGRSGGTWNRGGMILFATAALGLHQASARGGSAELIMASLTTQEFYSSPFFLPDGYHFLQYMRTLSKEARGIYVASLDGTVKQRLLGIDSNAVYAPSLSGDTQLGYLLFDREGALLAQPFDSRQMKLTGEPLSIAEQVGRDTGYWNEVRGNFSVSDNGLLVYDSSVNRRSKQLILVDRQGKLIRSLGAVGGYTPPCLSPDEKRVVIDRFNDQTAFYDLWLYDVRGGGASQFTFDASFNDFPVWSPDGRRIIWRSNRDVQHDFYWKAASGTGQDELLLKSSDTNSRIPTGCSVDGRFLIYYEIDPKTKRDIWVLPLSGDRKPFKFLKTEASEAAGQPSPDGRWMAYTSNESSLFEVYVRSFPSRGSQRLVSTNGGIGPYWRRDGKELFYYTPDGKLMAVEVKSGAGGGRQEASFEAGLPRALFEFRSSTAQPNRPYAVTADGQRFLLSTIVDESGGAPLTVVVNWQAGLKR